MVRLASLRRRARRGPRLAPRDRGAGYIETIVAISIMGILSVPLMNGFIQGISSSSRGRSVARVETTLQDTADRLNRAPLGCDYLDLARAAVQMQGWALTSVSLDVHRFVPGPDPTSGGTWVAGACQGAVVTPNLVQKIRITINGPGVSGPRSLEVVKSDV